MATAKQAVKKVRIPKAHNGSVAARVRYLDGTGMKRADIARQLDVRYQRVRNVLVPRTKAADTEPAEATEIEADDEAEPTDSELAAQAS